ncbi:MAG: succinylglutamate desuccinylase/aspartoacylase family protein [Oligoflexus sp.]
MDWNEDVEIAGVAVKAGQSTDIYIELARLYDFTELSMPLRVVRGHKPGPTMFVSGAIHGDEIIGPEIIRRLLHDRHLKDLHGTLIAVPIVNVFGYNRMSRYLPDRRDLNRSFPGSPTGSLAARVAHLFFDEVVRKCQYGIDIHSAAIHRSNLPQIRACLDHPETERLARAFGVPVIINAKVRDGSLREAAEDIGQSVLLFEGGEGLRTDESIVRKAVNGILSVMQSVGMLPDRVSLNNSHTPEAFIAKSSYWVRAPESGALRFYKNLGTKVPKGARLGVITDVFGGRKSVVRSPSSGIVIGRMNLPLVNKGDALFHIATFEDVERVFETIEQYDEVIYD